MCKESKNSISSYCKGTWIGTFSGNSLILIHEMLAFLPFTISLIFKGWFTPPKDEGWVSNFQHVWPNTQITVNSLLLHIMFIVFVSCYYYKFLFGSTDGIRWVFLKRLNASLHLLLHPLCSQKKHVITPSKHVVIKLLTGCFDWLDVIDIIFRYMEAILRRLTNYLGYVAKFLHDWLHWLCNKVLSYRIEGIWSFKLIFIWIFIHQL